MKIDIYRSTTDGGKYLSVPAGTDIGDFLFPSDIDADLKNVAPFKADIEIIPGRRAVGLDPDDISRQIEANGFATHGVRISFDLGMGT
ncbi:MAG: hypothetical protein ACKO0Z_12745 [Betaproteobacteria bacterium]